MTDELINHMVHRFLSWRLPENFNPDAGISFKADYEHSVRPMKHEPIGTNLFSAIQAEEMVRYMVEGLPAQGSSEATATEAQHAGQWRPIESAPRDGTMILACEVHPDRRFRVRHYEGHYEHGSQLGCLLSGEENPRFHDRSANRWAKPTHWHPLPAPPPNDAREHSSPRQVLQPIRDEPLLSKGGGESPR